MQIKKILCTEFSCIKIVQSALNCSKKKELVPCIVITNYFWGDVVNKSNNITISRSPLHSHMIYIRLPNKRDVTDENRVAFQSAGERLF